MKNVTRREFLSLASAASIVAGARGEDERARQTGQKRIQIGYHFWNCSRQWDTDLDRCLRLASDTGYQGFEALLEKINVAPALFRAKCDKAGLTCAAISGNLKDAIDFAYDAGIPSVRSQVPKEKTKKWVDYAGERKIVIAVHNHIGRDGQGSGSVETRDDLLRYLDERPGVMACPDTGHLLLCGDDPVQTIYDLGVRLACIHLKDVNPKAVGKGQKMRDMWFELGTGALDVAGVMKALEKTAYTGWVVVEYGNQVEDFYQSAHNMRRVLKQLGH